MVRRNSSKKLSHRRTMSRSEAGRLGAEARWGTRSTSSRKKTTTASRKKATTTSTRRASTRRTAAAGRRGTAQSTRGRSLSRSHSHELDYGYEPMEFYGSGSHRTLREGRSLTRGNRSHHAHGSFAERAPSRTRAGQRAAQARWAHEYEMSGHRGRHSQHDFDYEPHYSSMHDQEPMQNHHRRSSSSTRTSRSTGHRGRTMSRSEAGRRGALARWGH